MLGKTLLACATLVVATVAQSQMIAFTNPPANITAGQPVDLTWAGGDGSPVTLTLQQGLPSDLQTVQLITGSATGTSYTFTVPSSLPNASNYAFKIQQGDNPPNYTGMITLTGGATSGPTLAVSALATSSSSSSSTATSASVSATSTVGTNPASGGVIGGGSSGSSNSNSTSSSGNATTTTAASGAAGTGAGAGASGSAATGTALSRNTTMSIATLTSSSAASSSSAAASTSSGSSTGTSTGSSPAPSSSKTSAAITIATSNFALLCAAVVGIAYLG